MDARTTLPNPRAGQPAGEASPEIESRDGHPVAYLLSAEFSFLVLMLACCAIDPSSIAIRRGLSYYGNSMTTGLPYGIGFALFIAISALGLTRLDDGDVGAPPRFRSAVAVLLALMAVVPLTPYAVNDVFDWLHIGFVSILFSASLVLGTWIVGRLRDRVTRALFLLEVIAGVAILAAQVDLNAYMIPSELAFQFASFGLVLQGIRHLPHERYAPARDRSERSDSKDASNSSAWGTIAA